MDRPVFIKPPRGTTRIAIVDPSAKEAIVVQQPQSSGNSQAPATLAITNGHDATKKAATKKPADVKLNTNSTLPESIHVQAPPRQAVPPADRLEAGFDVYATPFVPNALKVINEGIPNRVFSTAPHHLALEGYAEFWFGHERLPPLRRPGPIPELKLAARVTPVTHEPYFRYLLASEVECQRKENATYSLYAHPVEVHYLAGPPGKESADFTISVPGIREFSPYLEEDDEIVLRQVITDGQPHTTDSSRVHVMQRWNGLEYRGRVKAVARAAETLLVRVDGFTLVAAQYQAWNADLNSLKFNIQFPVPKERSQAMELVLSHVQEALTQASDTANVQYGGSGLVDPDEVHDWMESMLFPTRTHCNEQANLDLGHFNQQWIDEGLNIEQRIVVQNICLQSYGTVPYIISGPPGTGKTKTIIETALQLLKNVKEVSHILICAPSEPAADTLADRLRLHLQPHEMLRLNRPARGYNEVPPQLLQYCSYNQESRFTLPPFGRLMSYRVVVTSCRDASLLIQARLTNSDLYTAERSLASQIHPFATPQLPTTRLHWSALLLDEAAQAMEPEALLPLYVVSPPVRCPKLVFTPLFVMAGDERQLGPRTSSPQSKLRTSLLARLFAMPIYANHQLARGRRGEAPPMLTREMLPILRPPFTNLIRNYRSHPAILAAPSKIFYFDSLLAEVPLHTLTLARWDGWRGKRWPILYHNNPSPDDLEGDGGGWFNTGEADIALQYAARLTSFLGGQQRQICIMSPFKAQVRLLRKKARKDPYHLHDVNIGPTEAFQGLEHGVVILCVTRSRKRFVEKDRELNWGIIGQPNKMNVALTRAKSGLIIIGNQEVLMDDPDWRDVLRFYYRSGAVVNPQDAKDMTVAREEDLAHFERESFTRPWGFPEALVSASGKHEVHPVHLFCLLIPRRSTKELSRTHQLGHGGLASGTHRVQEVGSI